MGKAVIKTEKNDPSAVWLEPVRLEGHSIEAIPTFG